jgi:hypothetical protein
MTNCLVTKLKGVVDNNNLDYLDFIKFTGTFQDGYVDGSNIIAVRNSAAVSEIRLLNTDGATMSFSSPYFSLTKGSGDKVEILFPRYLINNVEFYDSNISWDYEKISSIYGITTFATTQTLSFSTNDFSFKNVESFELNTSGVAGDIAEIAKMPTIKTLTLNYNRYLTGDLSSIKDMPNLTSVSLNKTYVTDTNNAVAYMQNRGIEVTYVPYDD